MSTATIRRTVRFSVLTFALLVLAMLALLMLERGGTAPPVTTLPGTHSVSSSSKSVDTDGKKEKVEKDKPKHCSDGHGKDAEHSKNCDISEG
jgi:hypothetical protein